MNISYKRDMTHNYMVPDLTDGICEDDYRIHMLTENHIRGLLPCSLKKINCRSHFFYDITSRQSMEHIYSSCCLNAMDICTLLQGLYRALKEVKKYLLDVDRIVLQPDMIYMDIETKEPLFCYLPGYHGNLLQSFRELTAYLLEHIDQTDNSAVLLGYEIYRTARTENYSLEKLLQKAGREVPEYQADSHSCQYSAREKYFNSKADQPTEHYAEAPGEEEYYSHSPGHSGRSGYVGHSGYPASSFSEAKTPVSSTGTAKTKQTGKKTTKSKKEKSAKKEHEKKPPAKASEEKHHSKASSRFFLIVCFGFAIFLALIAMWFWKLDTTQIGGIIFLLVGLLAYGLSLEGKKKKRDERKEEEALAKAMEDFQEESCHEETFSPRENRYIKGSSAYAPISGYDVDSPYSDSKYDIDSQYSPAPKYDTDSRYSAAPKCDSGSRYSASPKHDSGSRYSASPKHDFGSRYSVSPKYGSDSRYSASPKYDSDSQYSPAPKYDSGSRYSASPKYDSDSRYSPAPKHDSDSRYNAAPKCDPGSQCSTSPSSGIRESRLGDTGVLYEENGDYAPHLVLTSMDPRQKNSIILEDDCYIIGKLSSQSDIVLEHSSVSRVHARIERYGNDYYLCDLNSTNGTFLNGKRLAIREPVKIQPNDEIAFARVRYHVGIC